ncbi:hypothetical protein [Flavobacterium sp.]|uniref:hypothetical protein n=1 Tax=Flavobacterium sp. TaxID=239 RepID=UPI0040482ABA
MKAKKFIKFIFFVLIFKLILDLIFNWSHTTNEIKNGFNEGWSDASINTKNL